MTEVFKENKMQHPKSNQAAPGKALPREIEVLKFLRAKDDTSRFVGLALLKPMLEQELDRQRSMKEGDTRAVVEQCWDAIPVKFLDRLLKAQPDGKRTKEEAESMVTLAVAVLHAFLMIGNISVEDDRFVGRVPLLMSALRSADPTTTTQIMQILATLTTTREGSKPVFSARESDEKGDQKPQSYIFVTVLLIDIRSTIPSLQEKLHSAEYSEISERISKAYDMISAFIGFLVQCLGDTASDDEDNEHETSSAAFSAPMPVDLLLKLRANISEVMSLTVEHLRDRYDSSTAGAAGLHPSARPVGGGLFGPKGPLPIAWDTSAGLSSDPLTLSQLRTLSLWLRDDDNDALRREASGITDVLLALYQDSADQDFRYPVLLSLESITETPEGVEAFLREECWAILAADLENTLQIPHEHARGIEIVRVLLKVVESYITGSPQEEWMSIIALARQSMMNTPDTRKLELGVAISQLAVELMVQASRNVRKRHKDTVAELRKHAETLLANDEGVSGGIRDGLEEVVEGLDSLGL